MIRLISLIILPVVEILFLSIRVDTVKLIGKTAEGKLLFGYSRLPGVDYSPYVIRR